MPCYREFGPSNPSQGEKTYVQVNRAHAAAYINEKVAAAERRRRGRTRRRRSWAKEKTEPQPRGEEKTAAQAVP